MLGRHLLSPPLLQFRQLLLLLHLLLLDFLPSVCSFSILCCTFHGLKKTSMAFCFGLDLKQATTSSMRLLFLKRLRSDASAFRSLSTSAIERIAGCPALPMLEAGCPALPAGCSALPKVSRSDAGCAALPGVELFLEGKNWCMAGSWTYKVQLLSHKGACNNMQRLKCSRSEASTSLVELR